MVKRPDLVLMNKERAKKHRMIIKCAYCGKEKSITLSLKKKRNYCNIECRNKDWVGKNNPMYGRKQSDKCRMIVGKNSKKFFGKNNPMFNKRIARNGMNYYFKDLGHRCRSSWEVNIARVLKYKNINYQYEPITFNLLEGDSYTPDFYLVDKNKFLEVKGYVTDKFKDKFSRFLKQYPLVIIEIIAKESYDQLIKKYREVIQFEHSGRTKRNYEFVEEVIKEIKVTACKPKKVYSLSVDEDESFVCNGFLVHNTSPHFVPIGALKGWSRRVLGDEKLAFAVRAKIAKLGVPANPFFRPALHEVKSVHLKNISESILSRA